MTNLAERLGIDPSLHDLWGQLDADTQAATALVAVCYYGHGYDLGRDRRLALRWWGEFVPERVTLAAMTSSTLQEFTADLSRRLKGQIGSYYPAAGEAQRALWQELIGLPTDRQRRILDILETQASVCVTLLRAAADARRQRRGDGDGDTQAGGEANPGAGGNSGADGHNPGGPDLFAAASVSAAAAAGTGAADPAF